MTTHGAIGCKLFSAFMPRMGVIVIPAWKTIAETTLPRSLPLVAYLNLGHIQRLTDLEKYEKLSFLFLIKLFSMRLRAHHRHNAGDSCLI